MRSTTAGRELPASIILGSPAFMHGRPIPRRHTCQGEDLSPALEVAGLPAGTKALALIVDDPDAPRGTWTHWTVWDLPATCTSIPEGFDPGSVGAREGTTSAGNVGYHGPCPPSGTHRYVVRVYALARTLRLAPGAPVQSFRDAVQGAALAYGELVGTYAKS
jgi:Raf kinase inhibitor-like YbhB/YbcL family protein